MPPPRERVAGLGHPWAAGAPCHFSRKLRNAGPPAKRQQRCRIVWMHEIKREGCGLNACKRNERNVCLPPQLVDGLGTAQDYG